MASLARRSKYHDEPSIVLDHQLIQRHFTGIRYQCSSLHRLNRRPPEPVQLLTRSAPPAKCQPWFTKYDEEPTSNGESPTITPSDSTFSCGKSRNSSKSPSSFS